MTNHRCAKLCKAKVQYTAGKLNRTQLIYGCMNCIYRSLHTISHFPILLGFFVGAHCRCCDSNFVQLFNLVFYYLVWPRQATMIVKTASASSFIGDI